MRLKRLISSFVMCAMLVTLMPMQAFAVDDAGEATTWTKELSVDELYHVVQDRLNENNAIALEDLTAIEAIASDVRDDVTGQLTAIAFDDQQVVLAELDDTTSYTLTFAEEDNADAAPAEPDAQPEVESDAGESVTVPDESAANDPSTESQQTTGPPTQSDVSLTVTEEEVFTTEAEAEEQAQEQGVDPAEVSTEIGENGQVLGAMLTVNETEVSKVALVYTANVQNTSDEIMPLSPMSNGETITLSVGDDDDVTGTGGFFTNHHRWQISGDENIVKITDADDNQVQITAYQEGKVELTHTYRNWGSPKKETWTVIVQKKEYGICTFDVYYLIGDELPDPLYGNGEAENYGPSRNDTPMCEVSIDIDALLENYYPNGANEGINYNGANTWYITYETCGETNPEDWWDNVLRCMDEASKEKLRATGLFEIFQGYVLKNQNPDGDYHLDGQLVVPPPVNVVELYLNTAGEDEYIGGTAVSADIDDQTTKDELRKQYEAKFKTEFGEGTAKWVEGNIYFQTADKYYRLTESADPEQSITDNEEVQFTNRSDEHHVARFYLTSSEMPVAYTQEKITIQKTDAEGELLSGAQFALYSDESCEHQVGRVETTGDDGKAEFTVTAPDTYYVKEIAAPEGYVLSDETKTVTVTTTGEPTIVGDTVTFTLSASPASLTFTNKAKPTVQDVLNLFGKKAVADAGVTIPASTFSFTLTKQDGTGIATATATVINSEPVALASTNGTTKLDDGTYTLAEDAVTTVGWTKDETTYTIKIEDGEITVNGKDAVNGKYLFTNIYNQPKATLTVQAVDEEGNVLLAEGWPESVELPIGASYHITVGTPIGTEHVNVSDEITTTEGDHYVYVDPKDGSELTGRITADVTVTLVYGLDNIGTEDPDVPDGVLDKYQVLVEFISADESTGTVGGQTQKVYTKIGFVNPDRTENGYINVSADGVTITPEEGYVFAYWTKDDETKETTLPKNGLYVTSDVEKIVFKAHFGEDKISEKDPNESDGIADVFQVLVNFEVKNGSWNDGTSDTVQKVFTRKSSGKLSLTGTYTLQDADWPSVGQKPAQGFKAAGSWYEGEYKLSLPVKLTQNSLSERTFTFIYEPLGEYELWIEHRYLGGLLDNDQSYPYYDSTNDFREQFYSTRFDFSEELVLAGTTIQLQELLSDKMDAGYKYGTYDFVTAPGVEDLKINESNPSWEMPEGWMKLVILYVPRTDLSYTVNYLDADTNEPIQDAKTVSNQTYGAKITSADEVVNVPGYTFNHADKDALTITAVAENNVINLYYKKASYTVTYQWENDLHPESAVLPSESTYKMGDPVGIDTTYTIGQVVKDNSGTYRFAGWSVADISVVDGQFVMPARDVTIIGAWVPMIEVTPADITIYTGGNGYTGAVNGSEALTDSGLPEPGFYVTLPEALDKALKAAVGHVGNGSLDLSGYVTITAKASDGNSRSWKLERYDNQPDHESMAYGKYIYRIVPTVEGQDPVRVQFTDDQGNVIRDDEFDIKLDTLYQKYDMSIYPGRVNENTVKITVNANQETGNVQAECAVDSRTGELTVRGIVNAITTDIVNAVPENAANITAIADAGTEYYINGSKLEVADGHKVKLLVDEIVDDAQSALKKAIIASSDNDIDEDFEFRFKYLDLVDTSNGNVWITPSKPMTVFWPYPKGTDEDTEFQVIHFDGLDRNYDNLETELEENSPEYLNVTHVAGGITFTVDSFSPFALVWEADDDNGGGGAHHPDAGDGDDDDDDDEEEIIDEEVPLAETPWLNTEDHYAYIIGYAEDGTVRPNANITRAEVATIFFRLLTDEARDLFWSTSNNFSDVTADAWYNNAVSTMVNAGIIQGYEDGTFRPNNNITRAEFAAIASRFMSSGYDVEEDLFTDIANHWARENINDAAMAGWINGYPGGIFLPDQAITRAEAVTLVNNVLQRKPDADHMLDSMIKWPDNPEGAWYYEAIQEATNSHDYDLFEDAEYEIWTALQPNRDWAAIEKGWLDAHSA